MKSKPHFVWDDTHSVHVKIIDNQHRAYVETLEKLYQALMNKKEEEELHKIMDELQEYVKVHFATEEKYFHKFNYKDTKEHEIEHRSFEAKIQEFQDQLKSGELKFSLKLFCYLEDWLVKHLNTMDKLYIDCFTSHGLK